MVNGAAGVDWTLGLTLTKGALYHWATAASYAFVEYLSIKQNTTRNMAKLRKKDNQKLARALKENLKKRKAQSIKKREKKVNNSEAKDG